MEEINFKEMAEYFWRKKIIVIGVILISALLGWCYTKFGITPMYKSTTSIILTENNFETEADVASYSSLVERYWVLADSYTVAGKVIENLKLNAEISDLKKNIVVSKYPYAYSLCITVENKDSLMAKKIADEMAKVVIEEVKNVYNDEKIMVLDQAVENNQPINIDYVNNIAKFIILGIILVVGILLVKFLFFKK